MAQILGGRMARGLGPIAFGIAVLMGAQSAASPIGGYFDPHTNTFTPLAQQGSLFPYPSARTKVETIKGKLVVTATIKLDSGITSSDTVSAHCIARTSDPNYPGSVGLVAQVKHSGSTATVAFTIPFLFAVSNQSDTMSIALEVSAESASGSKDQSTTIMLPLPKSGTNAISMTAGV